MNFEFWQGQSDVVLVQMANILPPTISNTDDDWLIPGASLEPWGGSGQHTRTKTIVEDDEMIVAIPDDSKQCTFLGTARVSMRCPVVCSCTCSFDDPNPSGLPKEVVGDVHAVPISNGDLDVLRARTAQTAGVSIDQIA